MPKQTAPPKRTRRPKFQYARFTLGLVGHGYQIDFEIGVGRARKPDVMTGTVCRDFAGSDGRDVTAAIYDYFIEQRGVRPEQLAEGARQRRKARQANDKANQ
jgi:hypothetical protein